MVVVPDPTAERIPEEEPMDATERSEQLQVPPGTKSIRVEELSPVQSER